ncbi:MAG: Sec-independent protein translocase protein TatB [Caulobacteraceae bacterium]|nr:Sec-independent protein translocase protein TatB [Caulobacteraceae bacterium]
MGGLGPGIGGFEILVIGLVALLVVGPKDLPVMMRKLGKAMARARAMANDFRASFDEMARQSELDELRKEVDALRRSQMVPLGAEAEATFREINADLNRPVEAPSPSPQPLLTGPEEFADPGPSLVEASATTAPAEARSSKPRAKAAPKPASATPPAAKPRAKKSKAAPSKTGTPETAKPRVARKKAVDL